MAEGTGERIGHAPIAVVGDERSILGFRPFGVDVHIAHQRPGDESLGEWFDSIVRRGYRLILVTETVAAGVRARIDELWMRDFPVILTIRGMGESKRMAFEHLRGLIIKAVGTDLFKEQ
jgi:vacuolar-type H+-ATPase subunit F/Vma7